MQIAVLIPCYNEEHAIAAVLAGFAHSLPTATLYVCDNGSTDRTWEIAQAAGAQMDVEMLRGKGSVVRRMFADIDADIYVLVDGDGTYDAAAAPQMITRLLDGNLDMVTASRVSVDDGAFRSGHRTGNIALSRAVGILFGTPPGDMLSGYRVMSRRFVKTFPALSTGFEIETELTIHALEMRLRIAEVETAYRERQPGSSSKLHTYGDGIRISRTILRLLKQEKPFQLFGVFAVLFLVVALGVGVPVILEYEQTGLVPRFPSAILAAALVILSFLSFMCGLILESTTRAQRELKYMAYAQFNRASCHRC